MSDYPNVPQQISDPISENLAKLAELFPAAVKDGCLDIEALRAELGEFKEVQPGDETYELNWVGKQAAKKEAFKPLLGKTLALKDDGKNSETTQNIYIEGDNLEALKILRQNYYGEVKMIYIDPPYNTGKDFVYKDNFTTKSEESEQAEGSVSSEGERFSKNERSSNRFHARWLDMIYPRIKLAKELLSEDGVIFISIDDNEVANLRQVCDDVFGENNFVSTIAWEKRYSPQNAVKWFSEAHDFILIYAKEKLNWYPNLLERSDEMNARYRNLDNDPRGPWKPADATAQAGHGTQSQFYTVTAPNGKSHKLPNGRCWVYTEPVYQKMVEDNRIWFGESGNNVPAVKRFLTEVKQGTACQTIWKYTDVGHNQEGKKELNALFPETATFDTPKPVRLLERILKLATIENDLVLDFFSGSATTAHAVMRLNAEDGGTRRFIMVQLPEICAEDSDAAKAGYKTISEISKERIRRAGKKIKEELQAKHAEWKKQQALDSNKGSKLELVDGVPEVTNPYIINPEALDIGFKSFRIEDTKINWLKKDLRGEQLEFSDTTTQDALDFVPGFTDIDVVYELMLRQSNIPLTGAITNPEGTGKRTYLYADSYLVCLEEKVTRELVEKLAAIEPTPTKYIFRDSAFGKDIALKDETFRRLKAEIHKNHGDTGSTYTVEFI
jgi:adenine-specific DNA-methyltransferase